MGASGRMRAPRPGRARDRALASLRSRLSRRARSFSTSSPAGIVASRITAISSTADGFGANERSSISRMRARNMRRRRAGSQRAPSWRSSSRSSSVPSKMPSASGAIWSTVRSRSSSSRASAMRAASEPPAVAVATCSRARARITVDAGLEDRLQDVAIDEIEDLRHDLVARSAGLRRPRSDRAGSGRRASSPRPRGRSRRAHSREIVMPSDAADLGEALGHRRERDAAQVVALTAREDREGDLLRIRRREDEEASRRGLLEGLQQRVERRRREHVDFVDDEDPVAAGRRGVADRLDDLAHVVDAGAARGVDLLDVGRAALGDLDAGRADAAGRVRRALLAVQAAGDEAGEGRLADAARAGEQDRVGDAAARMALRRARVTWPWPETSSKLCGRHLRAMTW